jgi:4-amino-4-deoxy-L-arabinose transferase-like glycosyltransferase
MNVRIVDTVRIRTGRARTLAVREAIGDNTWRLIALGAIVALAAALRFIDLSSLGYVNHYYSAAVTSMLKSWHNFFFVAAEPGGSVTVDKPPLGLWLQAGSAFVFGVNTLGLLLPEIAAGLGSIVVVYHLVRRSFGTMAGLVAALALAITPVMVATDRNNTIDSLLILTLLLAAWAFIKATESGKLRFLLLGAGLVGLGFNIKMLQAFLPLPAFVALYFLGSKERLLRKVGRLALAMVLLLVVSLSWVTIVDLTPAGQRPYVGSSGDNSEMSLIAGYNGLERLLGMQFGRGGNSQSLARWWQGLFGGNGGQPQPRTGSSGNSPRSGNVPPTGSFGNGMQPPANPGGGNWLGRSNGGRLGGFARGGGGFSGTGQAGLWRLFSTPLSKEVSWLLPFGLFGGLLVLFYTRPRWPFSERHQAAVLWGGWLLTGGAFFSVAGFFHEYYLSMLAAPLAALAGMGAAELWRLHHKRWWLALALLLLAAGATLAFQVRTAQAFVRTISWQPLLVGLLAGGAALLIAARGRWKRVALAGLACVLAAMLVTPGIWSELTAVNSTDNQSLPAAYDGRTSGPPNRGGLQVNQALVDYLQAHTQGTKYLMAVPSAMQGADYVLATGRPVLYLGGFMGIDRVETSASLAQMVAEGELRYIYWNGRGGGFGGQSQQPEISNWVMSACQVVQGYDTETQNSGAPDGTTVQGGGNWRGFGEMNVRLYDCGG